jgi:phosphodiesterase/alkaline phosphatase D-like protein
VSCDDEHQLLKRAERDQFAYYLTLAYLTVDPSDWPAFRRAAYGALVAARYLDRRLARTTPPDDAPDQRRAMLLLDEIHDRYDPAVTWAGFVLELWARRHEFDTEPAP